MSIRTVGDFTRRLPSLGAGTHLDVYGPFGGFTSHRFAPFRRLVCIGAGIGITPFLGMLAVEPSNHDFRRIWLYYVVRDEQDLVRQFRALGVPAHRIITEEFEFR